MVVVDQRPFAVKLQAVQDQQVRVSDAFILVPPAVKKEPSAIGAAMTPAGCTGVDQPGVVYAAAELVEPPRFVEHLHFRVQVNCPQLEHELHDLHRLGLEQRSTLSRRFGDQLARRVVLDQLADRRPADGYLRGTLQVDFVQADEVDVGGADELRRQRVAGGCTALLTVIGAAIRLICIFRRLAPAGRLAKCELGVDDRQQTMGLRQLRVLEQLKKLSAGELVLALLDQPRAQVEVLFGHLRSQRCFELGVALGEGWFQNHMVHGLADKLGPKALDLNEHIVEGVLNDHAFDYVLVEPAIRGSACS